VYVLQRREHVVDVPTFCSDSDHGVSVLYPGSILEDSGSDCLAEFPGIITDVVHREV
jgi:hypothetical protein